MTQRSVIHKHAVYAPRPLLERPAVRSHAKPMDATPEAAPAKPVRRARTMSAGASRARKAGFPIGARVAQPFTAIKDRRPRQRLGLAPGALWPAALLLCAFALTFAGLVVGLSALLQQALRGEAERAAFPLLAGGMMLILLRGKIGVKQYWQLRRSLGLAGHRHNNHALVLLYVLAFFFATAIIATLLACGAALLIAAIVHP